MHTIIGAGGSGTRVVEAVIQLCAAGLGPNRLRVLLVDPDASNGNVARLRGLVERYRACHERFARHMGDLPFFRTELDVLVDESDRAGKLYVWNVVAGNKKLRDVLGYDNLAPGQRDLTHLFFTDDELDMELDQGFRGHTAIGAAALSLLDSGAAPWKGLTERLRIDLGTGQTTRVVLAGSVFGGTGASALYPIARFLRDVPEINKSNLKLGVVALVPYFQFDPAKLAAGASEHVMAAKSQWFALATRQAVRFYHHLKERQDWPFDAMYWVGDSAPWDVAYAAGGPRQENPAHVVDVVAALAAIGFLDSPPTDGQPRYSGPRQGGNVVAWDELPAGKNKRHPTVQYNVLTLSLVGAVHLGFGAALLADPRLRHRAHCVPWYKRRHAARGDWLDDAASREALQDLSGFFAKQWFPWWEQVAGSGGRVHLVNRGALVQRDDGWQVDLTRIGNLVGVDQPGSVDPDCLDRFFDDMVHVPNKEGGHGQVAAYLGLLGAAARRYVRREYRIEPPRDEL